MIGRLILSYPVAAKRLGGLLVLLLVAAALYAMGISATWMGKLVPSLADWLKDNKQLGGRCRRSASRSCWRSLAAAAAPATADADRRHLGRALCTPDAVLLFLRSLLRLHRPQDRLHDLAGVVTTLYISAISIAIATLIALAGAIAKLSKNGAVYGLATFYTSLFRGLPLLMQIYIIYLGLPQVGYVISAVPAGILALSLCYGAYMTEIFRAGIESIPRGQTEGATALGLSPNQTMFLVILPQAMRVIVPPTGNQFIAMLKDSSLVSVVGVWEIMYLARTQGQTEFRHIEMLITASMIYWILSIGLEMLQSRIEAHFGRFNAR